MQGLANRSSAVFAAFIAFVLTAAPSTASSPSIMVDGQVLSPDVPPLIRNASILVPLRGVFERLGAKVAFDRRNQTARARTAGRSVTVKLGSRFASIDGRRFTLEAPAREFAGRIEVPLRFVAEALGASVDFDAGANAVAIVSGSSPGNFVAASSTAARAGAAKAPTNNAPPQVEEQRPSPNSLIGSDYPQLYGRFAGGTSAVDPATVRVALDGNDVSSSASISSAYFAYTPPDALQDGRHTVEVSGRADDGTPFSDAWSFRVDAGNSSSASTVIGYGNRGFGYPRYGFYPPGFSVYAPGPQYYCAGNIIEVVFFSRFFPFGSGFFTIGGLPGIFELTPWNGFPGFYIGTATVPFGARSARAIVAAHFRTSDGRRVIVHSTAPLNIDGNRRSVPSDIRFAVTPRLIARPLSPAGLVEFKRLPLPTGHLDILARPQGLVAPMRSEAAQPRPPSPTVPEFKPLPNAGPAVRPQAPSQPAVRPLQASPSKMPAATVPMRREAVPVQPRSPAEAKHAPPR